jgi:hypothetical protein
MNIYSETKEIEMGTRMIGPGVRKMINGLLVQKYQPVSGTAEMSSVGGEPHHAFSGRD